jgi:hypothetical protein
MTTQTPLRTHTLETAEVDLVYDVLGPLPTGDGRPPLLMIGKPMDAGGFRALASYFPDRTVVTYDPRGLGRSRRKDGRVDNVPTVQAGDVHAVIRALDSGPTSTRCLRHRPASSSRFGEESAGTFTGRASVVTAELLGQEATVFPSHHGGFLGGGSGYAGQPEAFAHRLRGVLTPTSGSIDSTFPHPARGQESD